MFLPAKPTKRLFILSTISYLLIASPSLAAEKESVNQQLLKLLRQKEIVSEQQYHEWSKQLKKEKDEQLSLKYNKGLCLEPSGNKFSLKIKGRMEADSIFFANNHPSNDNFTVRRARLTLTATAHKYFGFKLQPEFTGSSLLRDASVDIKASPQLQFRIGQFKTPFGLEWSLSSLSRDFMFRSMAVINLSPDRDRGAIIQGELAKGKVHYALGIMNGSRPNQSDTDKHKDVVGRLVFRPFKETNLPALQGIHLGGSFTYGRQNLSMTSNSTAWWSQGRLQNPGSGTTFFQFSNGVTHQGTRGRYGLEGAWIYGPVSLKGEWLRVQMDDLSVNSQKGDFNIDGYYLALSCFLTGEEQVFKNGAIARVKPDTNFDPDKNTWGGVQLIARYDQVNVDEDLLTKGYADASIYTKEARSYTLGVNWYLNEFIRVMVDYVHADFDSSILVGGGRIDNEDTFMTRFQIAF